MARFVYVRVDGEGRTTVKVSDRDEPPVPSGSGLQFGRQIILGSEMGEVPGPALEKALLEVFAVGIDRGIEMAGSILGR